MLGQQRVYFKRRLVLASIVRDVYQGEALVVSLTTNAQRMLTGVAGGWAGKQTVTWFHGAASRSDDEGSQVSPVLPLVSQRHK